MSRRARLLNWWLATVERPALARIGEPQDIRRRFELQGRFLLRGPRGTRKDWQRLAGHRVLRLRAGKTGKGTLLWFHGGAYVFGSPRTHAGLVARISARTGLTGLLPDYPLAPEHPFPAAPEAALAIYRATLDAGQDSARLVLGGDSAGGGLALALLARVLAEGLPAPALTVLFSPWTDLTLSGGSLARNAASEVLLPVERLAEACGYYLGDAPPEAPLASPLLADFTGAAPVRIWVGNTEILLDDSLRMGERLIAQGVDARVKVAHDLPHVWPIFPGWILPEAEVTLDELAAEVAAVLR